MQSCEIKGKKYHSNNNLFIYIVQPMHISNPETIKDLTGMFSNI